MSDTPAQPAAAGPSGVIHDIGYQRYAGARLGRGYATWSLYVHTLRTSFGLGRRARAKVLPWLLLGVVYGIAIVVTVIETQFPAVGDVFTYLEFLNLVFTPMALFVAVIAPELVSRDLGNKLLPLYLARPIARLDYPLAKLGGLVTAVLVLLVGPQLIMYVGNVLDTRSFGETDDLLKGLAIAVIHALVMSSFGLVLASITGRRALAAGIIAGLYLLGTAVLGVLAGAGFEHIAGMFTPTTLVSGTQKWLFDTGFDPGPYGAVYALITAWLFVICAGLFLNRYRKVEA
jgi:ABC-2 type transport system permease protein